MLAGMDSIVRVTAGGPAGQIPGSHRLLPNTFAISHDRCSVAVVPEDADSEGVVIVGMDGGRRPLGQSAGPANAVAWSPDDRRLGVCYQIGTRSWVSVVDLSTGATHRLVQIHPGLAYRVSWLDNQSLLVLSVGVAGSVTSIDRVDLNGKVSPFLASSQAGGSRIAPNTLNVDLPRHRLLVELDSGTGPFSTWVRRLVWVDLETKRPSPAMSGTLGRLDSPFAAVPDPAGHGVAFGVGRAGNGIYRCAIVEGSNRTEVPGFTGCAELSWG
jgi:hypothetical protein